MNEQHSNTISRRDAIRPVTALLGGAAIAGSDHLLAFSFDDAALSRTMAQGAGAFTAADVALLDEIAETILPETSTPGAKAAKTGAFMALMVTDVYTEAQRQVFVDGMRQVDAASSARARHRFHDRVRGTASRCCRSARPRAEGGDGCAPAGTGQSRAGAAEPRPMSPRITSG